MKGFIVLITMVFMFTSSLAFGGGKIQKKGNDTYFELGGRYSKNDNMNLNTDSSGYDTDMKSNNGFGLSGEIGKRFGKNFRMGAEFAYRQAKLNGQVRQTENPLEGSVSLNEHETPGVADHEESVIDDHNPPNVADHEGTTVENNGHNSLDDHSLPGGDRQRRTYTYTQGGKTYEFTEYRDGNTGPALRTTKTIHTFTGANPNDEETNSEVAAKIAASTWGSDTETHYDIRDTNQDVANGENYINRRGVRKNCDRDSCSDYHVYSTSVTSFGIENRNMNHNDLDDHEHTVNSDGEHEITFNGEHSHSEDLDHEVTFNGMHSVNFDNFMENKDVDFGSRYLTTKSIMLNAYYDFDGLAGVTPWVGAGAGTTWANLADSAAFSYQLMAGVDMAVTDTTSLVLGYNWFQTQDIEMETRNIRGTVTDWKAEVGGHEVKLGVKFWF